MLIIERKSQEEIVIGDDIVLKIVEIRRGSVRIGTVAPPEISIWRDEIVQRRSEDMPERRK